MFVSHASQPLDFNSDPFADQDEPVVEPWERIDDALDDSVGSHLLSLSDLPDVLHSYMRRAFVARC